MLNGDVRILTGILARLLNVIITQIIHPDQTGFITGKHCGNNLSVIKYYISSKRKQSYDGCNISRRPKGI